MGIKQPENPTIPTSAPAVFHYGNQPLVAIMPMCVKWDDSPEEPEPEAVQDTSEDSGEESEEAEPADPEMEQENEEEEEAGEAEETEGEESEQATCENETEEVPAPAKRGRKKKTVETA
jgi:hypothetical protein